MERLRNAIELREAGKLNEANTLLIELANEFPKMRR